MTKPTGVHPLIRRTHEERILSLLRERGALSRGQISSALDMSRTNLSTITSDLLLSGAIVVADTDAAHREGSGRPAELLTIDPQAGQFLGVDFGHRRVTVALADASHEIIASGRTDYGPDTSWDDRVSAGFSLIDSIARDDGIHYGALRAVAIGVPGFGAGLQTGTQERERALARSTVERAFQARFNAGIIIDNNTRFAALAEAVHDASGGIEDLVYIRLSDGIGGGLIVGGRLVTGAGGTAAELGHVTTVPNGERCRCGRDGCLETVASLPAIFRSCGRRGVPVASLTELSAQVERRHPVVEEVLREAGAALGRVLSAAATILNPSQIVIGGEIVNMAPALLRSASDRVEFDAISAGVSPPVVRAADLDEVAGAYGAVAALFHRSPLLAGYPEAQPMPNSGPNVQKRIS